MQDPRREKLAENIYIPLTQEDIRRNFGNGAYSRGFDYFSKQYVLTYGTEKLGDRIYMFSSVSGSYIYDQSIEFSRSEPMKINAHCSCPVHFNCKHAAAALFQLLSDQKEKQESLIPDKTNWSHKLIASLEHPEEEEVKQSDYFLIYRLFETAHTPVTFYKVKWLKSGRLSKGVKVSTEALLSPYSYNNLTSDYISRQDDILLSDLRKLKTAIHGDIKFEGEFGAIVLKNLIQSGRCYFRDSSEALSWQKESKALHFAWKEEAQSALLVHDLGTDVLVLSETKPPLCIDAKHHNACTLDTTFEGEALSLMLDAPPLPKEQMMEVASELIRQHPQIDFPIPDSLDLDTIEGKPAPHLLLFSKRFDERSVHLMELTFVYGGYRLMSHAESDRTVLRQGGRLLKFVRDPESEKAFEKRIEALGFSFDPITHAYLSYADPSMQEAIERWRLFLEEEIPTLEEAGWQIEIEENFSYRFDYPDTFLVDTEASSDTHGWFELSFDVEMGGRRFPLLPIVTTLLEEFDSIEALPEKLNLQIAEGQFIHIRSKEIEPMLRTLLELFEQRSGDKLLVAPYDAHLLAFDDMEQLQWKGDRELRALAKKLKDFSGIAEAPPSPALQATLRAYQQFGLDWLGFLYEYGFGGILADDMGLGKTVQALAHLQRLKRLGKLEKPSLIVMPTSLIGNWKNEIEKFTPDLSYLTLYGLDRAKDFEHIGKHDIILTTYQLAQRDAEKYREIEFDTLILDEAQKIKNPKTKMATAVKSFRADNRLALSGTPIENHLGELWSIFDFLMPGFLGNLASFKRNYQNPIEQENDSLKGKLLQRKISPFILRRTKEEVATELPPKTEIVKKAILGPKQAALYESVRVTMEKEVRDAIKSKGLARSHLTILDALLKLRQVCCHPQLLKLQSARSVKESAKLELFLELIDELHAEGKKTLVFSQFTSMLAILEEEIKKRKISYSKLTGSTRKRDEAIAKFTEGEAEIFLISLKAGGVGLNLVQADTVIHYDPWWNPAVENQATDRAYRIGQDKPVFVYKLIVADSIEEQILKLQEKKHALQQSIYNGTKEKDEKLDAGELLSLLEL